MRPNFDHDHVTLSASPRHVSLTRRRRLRTVPTILVSAAPHFLVSSFFFSFSSPSSPRLKPATDASNCQANVTHIVACRLASRLLCFIGHLCYFYGIPLNLFFSVFLFVLDLPLAFEPFLFLLDIERHCFFFEGLSVLVPDDFFSPFTLLSNPIRFRHDHCVLSNGKRQESP